MSKRMILIGAMGSGKTTLGRACAGALGWQFTDVDEVIVQRMGLTIPEIFRQFGEEGFRNAETAALRQVLSDQGRDRVIACGGGIITRPENISLIRRKGTDAESSRVIWLKASAKTLELRLAGDVSRPLLSDEKNRLARIRQLLEARTAAYHFCCDEIFDEEQYAEAQMTECFLRQYAGCKK